MNIRRLNRLIKALETEAARNMFNMESWITQPEGCKSARAAFRAGGGCGTSACIGGMAAIIAPMYFNIRTPNFDGSVALFKRFTSRNGSDAFADWLGITSALARQITSPGSSLWYRIDKKNVLYAIFFLKVLRDRGVLLVSSCNKEWLDSKADEASASLEGDSND